MGQRYFLKMEKFGEESILGESISKGEKFEGNPEHVYCQILGLEEMPEFSKKLPDKFFLPEEVCGNLGWAIWRTEEDGIERFQYIYWKDERFKSSPLKRGSRWGEALGLMLERKWKKYFGRRPLVAFHTHPIFPCFSIRDIATDKITPRGAFIEIVGSRHGIVALLRTKETTRLPLISERRGLVEKRLREKGYQEGASFSDPTAKYRITKILEEEGFGYYFCSPQTERILQSGKKLNGIEFLKVYPEENKI